MGSDPLLFGRNPGTLSDYPGSDRRTRWTHRFVGGDYARPFRRVTSQQSLLAPTHPYDGARRDTRLPQRDAIVRNCTGERGALWKRRRSAVLRTHVRTSRSWWWGIAKKPRNWGGFSKESSSRTEGRTTEQSKRRSGEARAVGFVARCHQRIPDVSPRRPDRAHDPHLRPRRAGRDSSPFQRRTPGVCPTIVVTGPDGLRCPSRWRDLGWSGLLGLEPWLSLSLLAMTLWLSILVTCAVKLRPRIQVRTCNL